MTTKFSIGQEVWFMLGTRPICMPISGIAIDSKPTKYDTTKENYGEILEWAQPNIKYFFWDCDEQMADFKWERNVFATKEELRKHVFGE